MLAKWNVLVVSGAAMIVTAEICWWVYRWLETRNSSKEEQNTKPFHQVLFFPEKKIPCKKYLLTPKGCHRKNCAFSHDDNSSFVQLIRQILKAKRSIDLCMFSITCQDLAHVILVKYRQGATVRIITDADYMNLKGSQMHSFQLEGIPIRHNRSSGWLMHHKFLIIDTSVVITGSFNWTQAAITGNHENVMMTNHPDVMLPYVREFEKLWLKFCPESGDVPPILMQY